MPRLSAHALKDRVRAPFDRSYIDWLLAMANRPQGAQLKRSNQPATSYVKVMHRNLSDSIPCDNINLWRIRSVDRTYISLAALYARGSEFSRTAAGK